MPAAKTTPKAKAKPRNKTAPTKVSVAAFVDAIENETRRKDAKTLVKLFKAHTGEKAVMWGPTIIGFGLSRYRTDAGREGDIMLAGFSPRKTSLVLYLSHCPERPALLKKLGKHKTGVGCLYVNKLADVDLVVLEELIAKSVAHGRAKGDDSGVC